eukprot:10923_1
MKHCLLVLGMILHALDSKSHTVMDLNHKPIKLNDGHGISSPNQDNCPECPFNITVHKVHPLAIQPCPSPRITSNRSNTSHHTSSQTIRCGSNTDQIQHYIPNECDVITETPSDHQYYETAVRRRRQLLASPYHQPNLAQACISYEMIGQKADCMDSIFLPLCLEPIPSDLNPSDISTLIADKTHHVATNVKSAVGTFMNGKFGISVQLNTYDVERTRFKLCLKNIIASTEDLTGSIDLSSIGISHGMLMHNLKGKESQNTCNIDGLPCFSFFFHQSSPKCVPDTGSNHSDLVERVIASTTEQSHDNDDVQAAAVGYVLYDVLIDFSPSLLYNLWALAIVIVFLNIVIYFCFCLKSSSSCADSDDDEADISNIIMIV